MATHFDVIVVGVGAMGSAACYHLAGRGVRVLGIEQFAVPNDLGSSAGRSRMIRSAYYEHPDYVPLIRRAFDLWHRLEAETGDKLLHLTGGIYMGKLDGEFVAGSLRSAQQHHLPHEVLSRDQLARRHPQFQVPPDFVALHEQQAGLLIPEKCIEAHAGLARQRGAVIRADEPVLEWNEDAAGVAVRTIAGEYRAEQIIFSSGAWTSKLLKDLGITLTPTRQVLGWFQPPRPELFRLGKLPVWAIDDGDGKLHYGFPILDERGLKIGHHKHGPVVDPDSMKREVTPEEQQSFAPAIQRYLPDADGPLLATSLCMYTYSPDGHFILDRHPRHHRVTLAAGFSGHGFKFASVIGESLADLAMHGSTDLPTRFLSLARFRKAPA